MLDRDVNKVETGKETHFRGLYFVAGLHAFVLNKRPCQVVSYPCDLACKIFLAICLSAVGHCVRLAGFCLSLDESGDGFQCLRPGGGLGF